MKVLILGGRGMAGHMLTKYYKKKKNIEVIFTSRDPADSEGIYLDITDTFRLEEILNNYRPDIIINCIGLLNENAANNPILAFQVNSILPHQLTKLTEKYGGKVIQISTDCVFSGKKGDYIESDIPDGASVYAQSKYLGEINSDQHLTIRTSIIGPELKENGIGLFLWFMKQKGKIKGYKKVFWNGVTTLELAKAIDKMIEHNVTGLYHLGGKTKISKCHLLSLIQQVFQKTDVEIVPDEQIALDRSIKSTRTDFHYDVPPYEDMLAELKTWME